MLHAVRTKVFVDAACHSKPEVGFEIQFDVPHNDKIYQHLWKVTDVVPVRKKRVQLEIRRPFGRFGRESFELFDEGGKTRLRLTPLGLETFAPATKSRLRSRQFPRGLTALTDLLKDFWHPPNLELSRKL
jgi:hypothetical protein